MSGSFVCYVGIAAVTGAFVGVHLWLDKKRREALAAAAGRLGMRFAARGQGALADGLAGHLPLFNRGSARNAVNAMFGKIEDVPVRILDYSFATGMRRHSSTQCQTVAAFGLGATRLPAFALRPEGALSNLFGETDIEFKGHREFTRCYLLRGPDEPAIRTVFDDRVLAFFDANLGWSVETDGRWLIVYTSKRQVRPDDLPVFLEQAFGVFSVFGQA
jgi:hypothetical protein